MWTLRISGNSAPEIYKSYANQALILSILHSSNGNMTGDNMIGNSVTGINVTGSNGTGDIVTGNNVTSGWDVNYVINGLVIPSIAICGILGNILNLLMLSWRYKRREADVLEKGVLIGLIALAISDMSFCSVILPHMFFYKQKTAFTSHSFRMFYHIYGLYFQNVFIKTSTWLTLIVGVARYVGICHPLKARIFIGLNGMRITCVFTYVLWFSLMAPLLWNYSVKEYSIKNTSYTLIVDIGPFAANLSLNRSLTIIWALFGFFIPIAILMICNVNLISALRHSINLRQHTVRTYTENRDVSSRITRTLIVLIAMSILLVSPSELLHFIHELFDKESYRNFEVAIVFTNVLQAINFAFHFALYCAVNVTFRRLVLKNIYMVLNVVRGSSDRATLSRGNFSRQSACGKSACRQSITLVNNRARQCYNLKSCKGNSFASECRLPEKDTLV